MGLLSRLVTCLIVAGGLAFWNLYGRDLYHAWLESMGKSVGFGEEMIGYFFVLLIAYIIAWIFTRRYEEEEV